MPRYAARYFFDNGMCLWAADDETREAFGYPIDPDSLALTEATRAEVERVLVWYDTWMNWDDPAGPGLWDAEECERFNVVAVALLARLRDELGDEWEIRDEFLRAAP